MVKPESLVIEERIQQAKRSLKNWLRIQINSYGVKNITCPNKNCNEKGSLVAINSSVECVSCQAVWAGVFARKPFTRQIRKPQEHRKKGFTKRKEFKQIGDWLSKETLQPGMKISIMR